MIDMIFFLLALGSGAALSYFLLKSFYDNAQRYESMSGELRGIGAKLVEAEAHIKNLEEENKHLRTQGEKILAENTDLKDVNGSNSRYGYLISQAAKQANDLLKLLDVNGEFSKSKEIKKEIPTTQKFEAQKFESPIIEPVTHDEKEFSSEPKLIPVHIENESSSSMESTFHKTHISSQKRF